MTLQTKHAKSLAIALGILGVGVLNLRSSAAADSTLSQSGTVLPAGDHDDDGGDCRSDDRFEQAVTDLTSSLTAIRQGDAAPYIAEWSSADDVTLFGAWGPIEQGHEQLSSTFRWVASRFGPEGETVQDIQTVHRGADLAVTVGFERGPARVDDGPVVEMVIRVTHVMRCEAGEWKLVHRHADFPTEDPRQQTD